MESVSGGGEMLNTATADAHTVDVETVDAARAPVEGFAPLRVKRVIRETADAVSLVFEVPGSLAHQFTYQSGQFMTLLVEVGGQEHRRCYSMSSSPLVEEDLWITVKRDRDGVVSNWLNDHAAVGDDIHAAPPAGRFVLCDSDREVVAFAGGSGVTPVFSLIRSTLAGTARKARLFYANRDQASVMFADALAELARDHPDRLIVQHHLDDVSGVVVPTEIESFIAGADDADYYICGPAPFMDAVESTVTGAGVPGQRVHLERFSVAEIEAPSPDGAEVAVTTEVTIELDRTTVTVPYRVGNTVLQTARMAGLKAPSSCETGSCGTCIAQVVEGSARMINNDALDDDEVADGLILTCQSLPTSPTISVIYE
jgi:3-ketosteroid 9alpha-monooxygenase subunit B